MRPLQVFALAAAAFVGCASCRSTPIAPDDVVDGGDDPCARACQRLATLGCAEAAPTDAGATCVEVCRNTEASGVVSLDPACVANIATCDEVDACVRDAP